MDTDELLARFPILKHFTWAHLPERLKAISEPCGIVAREVATLLFEDERADFPDTTALYDRARDVVEKLRAAVDGLPECDERHIGHEKLDELLDELDASPEIALRRLLEAKDCFVRARLEATP